MGHPYRENLSAPARVPPSARRLRVASTTFGFCCSVAVMALAGPRWAAAVTVGGVVLLLKSPRD